MKLSILPVSYFNEIIEGRMTIGDWAREGVSLNLDAIDISIILLRSRGIEYLRSFRHEIENEGISVCGASTYPDFTHPEQTVRKQQLEIFTEDLKALAEVGTRIVRVTAGQAHPGVSRADGINWAVDSIISSVPVAEAAGIQLVFENHAKPGVWKYHDFDFSPDIFLEIADQLSESPVLIQFDTANPIAFGVEPGPLLTKVIDRTAVVHASDTEIKGDLLPSVIGKGLVPFAELFTQLSLSEYEGWITIEEASMTGKKGVAEAVRFIRETWDSVTKGD